MAKREEKARGRKEGKQAKVGKMERKRRDGAGVSKEKWKKGSAAEDTLNYKSLNHTKINRVILKCETGIN